jgi:hypothetical protein
MDDYMIIGFIVLIGIRERLVHSRKGSSGGADAFAILTEISRPHRLAEGLI